ncbi:putative epoxide hydrolase [Aspergillus steynii IBT 23096]|uniref:Putative epoxide hydrolase n=1 Tax=Aspergillus steynii IBT 23096 TaxID=1392250 RepID=A0A2I2GSJ9_9EURO|nr:putative epoxide hydrolase [Aspergillus steynii IBT 23096]PLB55852.1 putative epoxide hydrolase [Aspergillus steynii IBT 23096]
MASIAFPSLAKKAKLSDGTTYGWVTLAPSLPSKVTFLLLHGYPSSCYDWRHQIDGLRKAGYGVIAPDLLGYGDTDKPTDPSAYRTKAMCAHMVEILDMESLDRVIAVGHDWGVALVSRLATYHPSRFYGIVTVGVSYLEPGFVWDIDAIHELSKSVVGYETFGYWEWHNTEQAAVDNNEHPASVFNLLYPHDPALWKTDFAPVGKAAEFVRAGITTPLPTWFTLSEYTTRDRIFSAGGYAGPLCWYKAAMRGVNAEDEADMSEEDKLCPLPNLFVAAKQDYVCRADLQSTMAEKSVPKLRVEQVDCGHWVQLEVPEVLNRLLVEFVEELT